MTIAVQGVTPDTFEIKSATLPLVALVLKSADLGALARDLEARYGDIQDFFDQDALVIDLSRLEAEAPGERGTVDFPGLLELLRKYRLAPVAVHGGRGEQAAAARAAGRFPAPDARIGTAAHSGANAGANAEAPDHNIRGQAPDHNTRGQAAAQVAAQAVAQAPAPTAALVIDKPLRSGQQVYARGRDLVMLDVVNPGAEVIADGHIHVYALLRGRAIAGGRGDDDDRVFVFGMAPGRLSSGCLYS